MSATPTPRTDLPLNVDSTMISCFRSCPQKFRKEFFMGYRPPGISIDLHAGACFATALEHVYKGIWEKGYDLDNALQYAHAAYALAWGNFIIPEFKRTAKTFDRVWDAVLEYFQRWEPRTDHVQPYFAADGKPTFEYTLAIPLEPVYDFTAGPLDYSVEDGLESGLFPPHPSGEPFLYSGRFDMLGSTAGVPVVRDEKTTGASIGQDWAEKWDLRSQFMGYVWACQQGGIPLDRVIVRGIAIMKTKIDLQEADKSYPRERIERWHEQLRRDMWRLRRCYDEGYFDYNFGDSCTSYGNCIFLTACTAPPEEEPSWLSNFEVRRWNPLIKNPIEETLP